MAASFRDAGSGGGRVDARANGALNGSSWVNLLEYGCDIRTVQELLARNDVRTTMNYTHMLNRSGHGVRSPVDTL